MSDETRNEPETQVIPQTDDAVTQAMPMAETRELPETTAPTQAIPVDSVSPEPEPATMPQQVPLYGTAPPTQTAAGGAPTAPAYVQVPVEAHRERPVIRKTGPSAATIVLGVLLVLIGAMVLAFGIGFPMTALPGLGADPRAIMAIVCGIVGGVLIVVAIIWAVARIIGSMRHKDDEPRE